MSLLTARCALLIVASLIGGSALAQMPSGGTRGTGLGFGKGPVQLHRGIKTRSYQFEPTGEQLPYAVFVPRRIDKTKPAPLVIALHGAGGTPESFLNWLATAADKHRYIVAAPMGYVPTGWYGFIRGIAGPAERDISRLSELDVMQVLQMMRAEFNIDPRRIYVVGASMGGIGAVHLATRYPDLWAAVGVISPALRDVVREEFVNYSGAPVVVLHGDRDTGVPVDLVRRWVARLQELKVPLRYHEYKGGTHVNVVLNSGENVFKFFDEHSRPEAPAAP